MIYNCARQITCDFLRRVSEIIMRQEGIIDKQPESGKSEYLGSFTQTLLPCCIVSLVTISQAFLLLSLTCTRHFLLTL